VYSSLGLRLIFEQVGWRFNGPEANNLAFI
jgi:hypothetical protein